MKIDILWNIELKAFNQNKDKVSLKTYTPDNKGNKHL